MGNPSQKDLFEIIPLIAKEFNINIHIINSTGYCCSQPYESKAFFNAQILMQQKTMNFLNQFNHKIPIIIDNTSCSYAFKKNEIYKNFQFIDSIEWIYDLYKKYPNKFNKIYDKIYLQNLCSLQKTNLTNKLIEILEQISNQIDVSPFSECCGFAGDKGMFYPEILQSSTRKIKNRLKNHTYDVYSK
ncbi:MAG: hypothetical protein KatS3mg129_0304 [Leptospiraceae bacterium]|nr:MAG: hypothetical protein KatS3mg129_0304 [Leptospiraceae bacterium]